MTLTIEQKRRIISGLKGIVGLGDAAYMGYRAADPKGWAQYYHAANAWAGDRWNDAGNAEDERAIIRELEEEIARDPNAPVIPRDPKDALVERLRAALQQVWDGFCGEWGEFGPPKRGGEGGWALEHLQPGDMPDWDAEPEGETK